MLELLCCRQAKGKKEKIDLDLIERILDVSEEKGQVCVKFRGMESSNRHSEPHVVVDSSSFNVTTQISTAELHGTVIAPGMPGVLAVHKTWD